MKDNPSHEQNLIALRRIEGQVRGIQRMIENREYCIDILNQIHAVKGALGRVEEKILKKHLQNCVTEAVKGDCEKLLDSAYVSLSKTIETLATLMKEGRTND